MSISKEIAAHLPYLRRFARALSGSQQSGDAYVVATLEALIADPTIFPRDMPGRHALYRVFLALWSTTSQRSLPVPDTVRQTSAERNLETLTPRPRQAFLLCAVEGFSIDEVARILSTSREDASALIHKAGQEIADQVATDVLIIEDEPIIALDIEALVGDLATALSVLPALIARPSAWSPARPRGWCLPIFNLPMAVRGWTQSTKFSLRSTYR